MSIALVIVFIFGINVAGGVSAVVENAQSLPGYLTMHTTYDPVSGTEQPYPIISIVSMIAWDLDISACHISCSALWPLKMKRN